jgi:hypothetical protein
MEDELKLNRKQIEISGGRTMNVYTFELDGVPMTEMRESDRVESLSSKQVQKPDGYSESSK